MPKNRSNKHNDSIDGNTLTPGGNFRIRFWNGEIPPEKEINDADDGEKITFINYIDGSRSVINHKFLMSDLSGKNINCHVNLNGNNIIVYGDKGVWWFDTNNTKNRVTFLKMPPI